MCRGEDRQVELSVCLSVFQALPVCLSVCLSVGLCLSVCLSVSLSVCCYSLTLSSSGPMCAACNASAGYGVTMDLRFCTRECSAGGVVLFVLICE